MNGTKKRYCAYREREKRKLNTKKKKDEERRKIKANRRDYKEQ